MKKVSFSFFFVAMAIIRINANNSIEQNLYAGYYIDEVINLLGEPTSDILRVINENYRAYEHEPRYYLYFSQEELRNSVIIRIVEWKIKHSTILVWGTHNQDGWIVFSSLRWPDYIVF